MLAENIGGSMFIIFGTSGKIKPLNVFENDVCGVCKTPNRMQLHEASRWATIFFIPIFKVTKEYYFVCPVCGASRKVDNKDAKEMLKASKTAQAVAVNKNVRAEKEAQQLDNDIDVDSLIKSDIDRVIKSIKDPELLKDSSNFDRLYSSLKSGLISKYGDAKLVEKALNEYFG